MLFVVLFFPKSCLNVGGVAYTRVRLIHESLRYLHVVYYISDFWKFHVFSYIFLSILISCSWRHNYWFRSLQCSCNLSVHVYIFVLCHHLGLGKCGGLGWRKICQESMCEVEKVGKRGRERKNSCNIRPPPHLFTIPPSIKYTPRWQHSLSSVLFQITPALQANSHLDWDQHLVVGWLASSNDP